MSRSRSLRMRRRTRPASFTYSRWFLVALGTSGVVGAMGLLYIAYNAPNSIPFRSYYTLRAQFADADSLTASYQVRVGGRLVGQVLSPHVNGGRGEVKLQLKPEMMPLLSDTTLRVRPRSPVGVRFVELHPGTKGTPLAEGALIPASQTSATVQIDAAMATLDPDRRKKTQVLLRELGNGFASRGQDINAAMQHAPPALDDLTGVAEAVNAVPTGVERFVAGSQSAAAAAEPARDDIAKGFAPEAKALRPLVDEGKALAHDLDVAPAALRSIQGGLVRVTPALAALEAVARNAEPTLGVAQPTLDTTRQLMVEARPGLAAAPRTLSLVRSAVPPTLGVLQRIEPVLPSLDDTLVATIPILAQLAPRDCDFKRFFGNWAETLAYRTSYSNVLRFSVEGSTETLQGYNPASKKLVTPNIRQSPYPRPCAPDTQKAVRP